MRGSWLIRKFFFGFTNKLAPVLHPVQKGPVSHNLYCYQLCLCHRVALLNYCNRLQTSISDSSLAPVELVSSKRCQTNPFKHKSDQCNLFLKAFQWLQSDSSKIIFFSLAPCCLPDPFFTTLSLALAFCFLRYMSSISFSQGFTFTLLSANNALPLHIYMT